MTKKRPAPPINFNISVVVGGRKYSGTYTVSGPGRMATVTVRSVGGSKSTHAGSSAEAIARDLLRELALEEKAGRGTPVDSEINEAGSDDDDSSRERGNGLDNK